MQIDRSDWFGIREAARLLHLSPQSLRRLVESQQIRVYRAGGYHRAGKLLFRGEWLLEYIEARTTGPVTQVTA